MEIRRRAVAEPLLRAQSVVRPLARPTAPGRLHGLDTFEAGRPAVAKPITTIGPRFTDPSQLEYTVDTHTGKRADPVTFYVHGSLSDLKGALAAGGWTQADANNTVNDVTYFGAAVAQECLNALAHAAKLIDGIEIGLAGVFGLHPPPILPTTAPQLHEVQEMPVSGQTYQGRPFVAAFEANNHPLGGRDHLRIFDTGTRDAQGQPVWAIAAARDTGIRFDPTSPATGFLGHAIEKDVDAERDLILSVLQKSGAVSDLHSFQPQTTPAGYQGGYVGDGQVYELNVGSTHPVP